MHKILVVDDSDEIRMLFRRILESENYIIEEASNGREAINCLNKQDFDLMLTDLIMPEMEGIETILKAKKDSSNLKIIAISGGGTGDAGEYLSLATGLGADASLRKPVSKKELLETISKFL